MIRRKIYTGRRDKHGNCVVRVIEHGDSRALRQRCDIANRSPAGFEWGYLGSGPTQLAIALLADATGSDEVALQLHQRFKFHVIVKLPRNRPWHLTDREIVDTAVALQIERMGGMGNDDGFSSRGGDERRGSGGDRLDDRGGDDDAGKA
jgi:hypothetical protein